MNPATSYVPKDFESDQEIRWCPGCGDYSILKQVQNIMPQLNVPKENIVFISGIGCSSRFPYYMNLYGIHSIHGRATTLASGLKMTNPDLSVWVVTGDGDGLSIGVGHTLHLLRRNFDINILLFNNQIYGLTKGQYSPTSEQNKISKSTPVGSIDYPFNPIKLAFGAEATFIARSMDRATKHLQAMLLRTHAHKGSSFLEIYQNCNIFNDKAFDEYLDKNNKDERALFLEHGKPLLFGNNKGIKLDGYMPRIIDLNDNATNADELWIHDEHDKFKAHILTEFFDENFPRPFGVLYSRQRDCYEDLLTQQIETAIQQKGKGNLQDLLTGKSTWTIK